jgi:UDP-glucose 4-epimerase
MPSQGARLPAPGGASATLNCGYGHGYSVREVIAMVDRLNGRPLKTSRAAARGRSAVAGRPGGARPPAARLDAAHDNLEAIVRSQLEWERRLQREPQLTAQFLSEMGTRARGSIATRATSSRLCLRR